MSTVLLRRVVALAALTTLGACAYATPYPAAFPDENGTGYAPADSNRSDGCDEAIVSPGASDLVRTCLRARGQAWDNRGRAIRQQAGYVGQLSIPLGIAGLGLSAGGDRSDFVPLSAGVSSAALAHTGAYARPTQAEVYELATDSYRCLLSAVAEWNAAGRSSVDGAFTLLQARNRRAYEAADMAGLTADDTRDFRAQLDMQLLSASGVRNRLDGGIGTALLRRSDEIDAAVIRAIRDRLPDPQAIAASIARGADQQPMATPDPAPNTEQKSLINAQTPAGAGEAAQGLTDSQKGFRAALTPAQQARLQRQEALAAMDLLLAGAKAAGDAFDLAATEYSRLVRSVPVNCAFNPSLLPALIATPQEIALDATGKGFFVVRNGVPPYGYLPPPTGVTLTPTPLSGTAMRFEVTASGAAGAGPWTLYVTDASTIGSVAEIKVTKAP